MCPIVKFQSRSKSLSKVFESKSKTHVQKAVKTREFEGSCDKTVGLFNHSNHQRPTVLSHDWSVFGKGSPGFRIWRLRSCKKLFETSQNKLQWRPKPRKTNVRVQQLRRNLLTHKSHKGQKVLFKVWTLPSRGEMALHQSLVPQVKFEFMLTTQQLNVWSPERPAPSTPGRPGPTASATASATASPQPEGAKDPQSPSQTKSPNETPTQASSSSSSAVPVVATGLWTPAHPRMCWVVFLWLMSSWPSTIAGNNEEQDEGDEGEDDVPEVTASNADAKGMHPMCWTHSELRPHRRCSRKLAGIHPELLHDGRDVGRWSWPQRKVVSRLRCLEYCCWTVCYRVVEKDSANFAIQNWGFRPISHANAKTFAERVVNQGGWDEAAGPPIILIRIEG